MLIPSPNNSLEYSPDIIAALGQEKGSLNDSLKEMETNCLGSSSLTGQVECPSTESFKTQLVFSHTDIDFGVKEVVVSISKPISGSGVNEKKPSKWRRVGSSKIDVVPDIQFRDKLGKRKSGDFTSDGGKRLRDSNCRSEWLGWKLELSVCVLKAIMGREVKSFTVWRSPRVREVKLNCAATFDAVERKIGIGIIIKDSESEVLVCCSQFIIANYNIKIANLIAILMGLQFAVDYGLSPNVIETNDAVVLNWIKNGNYDDSDFGCIVMDIRNFSIGLENLVHCLVSTSANKAAIELANHAMNLVEDAFWLEKFPSCISRIVESDKAFTLARFTMAEALVGCGKPVATASIRKGGCRFTRTKPMVWHYHHRRHRHK
ncbi:hypothetical protein Q3G72_022403 [Acer saccharum]|nr:hypothetical protein Q3G72_022403 [Acer saccharum]